MLSIISLNFRDVLNPFIKVNVSFQQFTDHAHLAFYIELGIVSQADNATTSFIKG